MQMLGQPFTILNTVESTNNYAMQCIQESHAKNGEAWLALYQTGGKGQRGKVWHSEFGKNIMLSLALNMMNTPLFAQFYLSAAVALGARQFFSNYCKDDDVVKIKWPNDIYWYDRKAGGILIENKIVGQEWGWAVVGIGININQTNFPSFDKRAVSLKEITGKDHDIVSLGRDLCETIKPFWLSFLEGNYEDILDNYNAHLFARDAMVALKKKHIAFKGKICGVNALGQLLVDAETRYCFDFGEVEWVLG